jgi:hypothetical protein
MKTANCFTSRNTCLKTKSNKNQTATPYLKGYACISPLIPYGAIHYTQPENLKFRQQCGNLLTASLFSTNPFMLGSSFNNGTFCTKIETVAATTKIAISIPLKSENVIVTRNLT